MENSYLIAALKQSLLFQGLSDDALQKIAAKSKTRQFFPDETIVWQGKASDSLFVIINGIVTVKKIVAADQEHTLAYLFPGMTFGEVGILENQPRSATVYSLSDVDCLAIRRQDFLDILHEYPKVAIELAKLLGRYLVESSRRQSLAGKKAKLILIFSLSEGLGATTFGNLVCSQIVETTGESTVYIEYPNPQHLLKDLDLDKHTKTFRHKAGYDIVISEQDSYLPVHSTAKTTLMLDKMLRNYDNVVIGLPGEIDENVAMMLDYAKQIIVLAPPLEDYLHKLEQLKKALGKYLRPNESSVSTIFSQSRLEYDYSPISGEADFIIPYSDVFPKLKEIVTGIHNAGTELLSIVESIVDRLERTNQISVFIPTTVDVDNRIDTQPYVERTLNFLAEMFGGATSKEAQGVWNSQTAGLVGEKVYIVSTYVTPAAMNEHLDAVVAYIKQLKEELRQEAMALEVNQKFTLI